MDEVIKAMGTVKITEGLNADTLGISLKELERRIDLLEQKYKTNNKQLEVKKNQRKSSLIISKPSQAPDTFPLYMLSLAVASGFTDTRFVRCPDDYYDQPLDYRRKFLNAPSVAHMTKSIVIQNLKKDNDFICCVLPYARKLDMNRLRDNNNVYKLADDCLQVTGYVPNAVTPLGLKTNMKIVLDHSISTLNPKEFWLGGGEISLKWNVMLDDFINIFNPTILSISVPE